MNLTDFEAERRPLWDRLAEALKSLESRSPAPEDVLALPRLYREACRDLSLVQHRLYNRRLADELNSLVMRSHQLLNARKASRGSAFFHYIFTTVPQSVRANAGLFWLCTAAFAVPYLLLWLSGFYYADSQWIESILGREGMSDLESMYNRSPSEDGLMAQLRDEYGSNFFMFCYYVWNNVSIDFRIFAGGIVFGIGSLFFLIFNGVYIGAAAGYIHLACQPDQFYEFVVGHSSWELIGMVLSGMAGMKLGLALIHPGDLTRREALAASGRLAVPLIAGAAGMTFIAAIIEGFWSAEAFTPTVKYTFGGAMWLIVALWLTLSGRRVGYGS